MKTILNNDRITSLLICLLSALLPTQSNADMRTFQIDVVIFTQQPETTELLDFDNTSLKWPKHLINPGQQSTKLLSSSDSNLENDAAKLKRKSHYQVLEHISWTQTIASEQAGRAVRIQSDDLNGFIQLKRGHNLHLIVGMEYPNKFGDNMHIISEQRRILLNQKHYFDHPRFGVIAQVSPL
ncbi:MAG: peptidoglycan binding protein CsiV [Gammaproteobacteria bacterium]|nr:peptidoglycan binding protein CsiV [Gammaproteobacteria bacterium]